MPTSAAVDLAKSWAFLVMSPHGCLKFFRQTLLMPAHQPLRLGKLRTARPISAEKDLAPSGAVLFWLQMPGGARRCSWPELDAKPLEPLRPPLLLHANDYEAIASDKRQGLYDRLKGMLALLVGPASPPQHSYPPPTLQSITDPSGNGSLNSGRTAPLLAPKDGSRVVFRLSGHRHPDHPAPLLERYVGARQTSDQDPSKHRLTLISAPRPARRDPSRTVMGPPTVHHLIKPAPCARLSPEKSRSLRTPEST